MSIYLANAIPNSWLLANPSFKEITFSEVVSLTTTPDYYGEWDDHIVPHRLIAHSIVGHASTAQQWGIVLGEAIGATLNGDIVPVVIPVNREDLTPAPGDKVVAGLFVAPYRLPEGERWSEDQILSSTHWVLVEFQ